MTPDAQYWLCLDCKFKVTRNERHTCSASRNTYVNEPFRWGAAGALTERARIAAIAWEHANEAQAEWEGRTSDPPHSVASSEYWRGQMNGLHHLLTEITGAADT